MSDTNRTLLAAWEADRARSDRMTHRSAIVEAERLLGRSRMGSLLFEMVVNRLRGRPARVLCAVRATAHGGSLESVAVAETWEAVLDKLTASLAEGTIDRKIQMARELVRELLFDSSHQLTHSRDSG